MSKLSHYDDQGAVHMVDVGEKAPTRRTAIAAAFVSLSEETIAALPDNPKGNPLEIARIAGIQAAKRTSELIPLCHPLPLSYADVECRLTAGGVELTATARTTGKTGVEMEAMTAVSVAALTIYDMCKALDKAIEIGPIRLLEKTGGKSGDFRRNDGASQDI